AALAVGGGLLIAVASPARAQTDYYNTDSGRPLTIEDATATERYAFELQVAPLRLERARGGVYKWEVEPEIAYGVLPRTQIEIGVPFAFVDSGEQSGISGFSGLGISILHNLNVETRIPALAISGSILLPVGGLAPDRAILSAKAIATRTFQWARVHLNAQFSFDDERSTDGSATSEIPGWLTGIAVDRAFPLRSSLLGGEVFVSEARGNDERTWNAAVGIRQQVSPAFSVDAGIGKQLTGDDRSWFITVGLARAFAIKSLLPGV
ncbi:MAG TPA: transporter, partial [Gemmatimonadaceae bacterium]|nr:transporter [Gemmatimonadaceae bacterium]